LEKLNNSKLHYHIKTPSKRAWLAAKILKANQVAIVFGNTIYLHNTTKQAFEANKPWLRHELKHIEQYQQLGYWRFIMLYLLETLQHGYYNNRFEVEARAAELE
jgi:hypothetical protein